MAHYSAVTYWITVVYASVIVPRPSTHYHALHLDRVCMHSKIGRRYRSDCQVALIVVVELGCQSAKTDYDRQ